MSYRLIVERPQVSTPISSRPVNLRDHAPAAVKLANWANASPSTRGGALPAYQNLWVYIDFRHFFVLI